VAVVVAGVIFVGHGQGQGHDDVYDHPSSFQVDHASILEWRLFLLLSATSVRLLRDDGLRSLTLPENLLCFLLHLAKLAPDIF
jgi:hypothetical protein